MTTKRFMQRTALAAMISVSAFSATAIEVTREFSGLWLDQNILGHGMSIDIIDGTDGKSIAATWYTFSPDGRPLWVAGSARVLGTEFDIPMQTLTATVQPGPFGSAGGGRFVPFGTLHIKFDSCTTATVNYDPIDPGLANGTMMLLRGTQRFAGQCTGGISDDRSANSSDSEIEQFLDAVGNVGPGKARARFEQRSDRSEFSIELEDLAVGNYRIVVGGNDRGGVNVVAVAGGTQGETEFRSPIEPGKFLLDFDPRGQLVEIRSGNSAIFSATLTGVSIGDEGGGGGGGGASGGNPPATGNAYYLMKLEPAGNDGPELEAELKQRSDRVEFSIEIEDAGIGTYALNVGGTYRGELNVVNVVGGTKGEIEFRNPVESGKLPLAFDPRGQMVEASKNGVVAFAGIFPTEPTATGNGGGDGGGGSDDDGGGSDDDNGDDNSGGGTASLLVPLHSTGADPDANGEASFESLGNEREFEVEIEDVADGAYSLKVGGTVRGSIQVSDERGKLKFASPARPDRAMLDFDPRGQSIEVWRDGTRYLAGQLP